MISFREITLDDAALILNWRTKARVTQFMRADLNHDVATQREWLTACFNAPDFYHWIIQYQGQDIGVLNFADWDKEQRTTAWGFYLGEESALGLGGLIPAYFYNFAFGVLGVEKITAQVFYSNINVIKMHLAQGYRFVPQQDEVFEKNGEEILLIALQLDKAQFQASRLSKLKTDFPLQHWQCRYQLD